MLTNYKIEEVEYCSVHNFINKDYYMRENLYVVTAQEFSKTQEWINLIQFMKENGYECFYDYKTVSHEYGDGIRAAEVEYWRFLKERGKE